MTRAGPLDVLGFIGDQQRFEDLVGASLEIQMELGSLRLLNLDELIKQKKRMNRLKDRAAIELLGAIKRS